MNKITLRSKRKIVSMRLSRELKKQIEHFFGSRVGLDLHNIHADYTFSFALRELIFAGVQSLEEKLCIDPALSQVQVRSFSKRRNVPKGELFSCHISCGVPVFLINRVCGVASAKSLNRAEAFRDVLVEGLKVLS